MFTYKVVLIGDFGTGKTSLISRYVDNSFSEEYKSSIGVSISKKNVNTTLNNKNYDSTIILWDIEGRTDFKPILSHYLNGAKAFIIVADLTRKKTIDSIKEHLELCEKTIPNLPICIALNKSDLEHEDIDVEILKTFAANIICVVKTSAKDNKGIDEVFNFLNKKVIERFI
jgi:small GTP-binding protein